MKKVYLFFAFCVQMVVSVNATVRTVSNDPNKPAQYTSPIVALDASTAGDTLYVYGSPNDYGDLIINKSITIIGAGFNTRKDVFYKTKFRFIDLSAGTVSNVTVNGLVFTRFGIPPALVNYAGIIIRNSIITGNVGSTNGIPIDCGSVFTNWTIENCFLGSINTSGNTSCNPIAPVTNGFLIKNTIIGNMGGNTNYNHIYVNCQIGSEQAGVHFSNQLNCVFNNCIFYKMNFVQSSANSNNQFNNCITYLTASPSQNFDLSSWSGGASGSANNCIINQNPLWIHGVPDGTFFGQSNPAARNVWNPVLQNGSPAINAGTDGTDIGLTGNIMPYNYLAEPKIPVVRRFQLANAVVPSTGTVTIQATATKAQ